MAEADGFSALVVEETGDGVEAAIRVLPDSALPEGDVTVAVTCSDLNYKDGMVLNGVGRLVRSYPHVPGVDFAGVVERSDSPEFAPGDPVILTGWRVGEAFWGGYATRARVRAEWLLPLPAGLTSRRAMALGTAGLTAMLAVMALEDHGLSPRSAGDVLVTGAAGGVGSVAIAVLAARGYRVVAGSGRPETAAYLRGLGAAEVVGRAELETPPSGPLAKPRWVGAIDNVGGPILSNLLSAMTPGGSCASVGLAAKSEATVSLLPFLLRGVNLLGIDSAACPRARRLAAWGRLAAEMPMDTLDAMTTAVTLAEVPEWGRRILRGQVRGRTLVEIAPDGAGR